MVTPSEVVTDRAPTYPLVLEELLPAAAERGIQRIRSTHHLGYAFLRHCGLSLW
jgi:hypothetical protein